MYNYSPETCLIQDTDGKIYNIIDLWNGIKTPVDLGTLQYNYSPRSCLVRNVDGADVNVIDTILAVANGSGSGTSSLEEVIRARGKYSTLGERLDKENEKVYETINGQDYIPFEGENIKVEHSKIGYTKDMKLYGRTLQNLFDKNVTYKPQTQVWYSSFKTSSQITVKNLNDKKIRISKYSLAGNWTNDVIIQPNSISYITTDSNVEIFKECALAKVDNWTEDNKNEAKVLILEGDWTNKDIPEYFEGIKSVGEAEGNKISILSKNKNLFFGTTINKTTNPSDGIIKGPEDLQWSSSENLIYVKRGVYTFSKGESEGDGYTYVYLFDLEGNHLGRENRLAFSGNKMDIPFDCKIRICCRKRNSNGWQLEEGTKATPYEPHKKYKKEIQLQQPLAGLKKVQDIIEETEKGVVYVQGVGRAVLDGSQPIVPSNIADGTGVNTVRYGIYLKNIKDALGNLFIANYPLSHLSTWDNDIENLHASNGYIYIRINKNKLETQNIEGFKKWLQANPITVYYQLAEPIEHKIVDLNTTNLETFKDITHVSSENGIQPNLSFKAPVNVQATISMLRENNARLSGEVDNKTKELQAKDEYLMNENDLLTAKDLDMDFRIFELEEQLMPEVAKLSSNYNSPYSMIERCIERGLYEKEDMLYKMGRYLHGNRLTQEEYDKLKLMMG